MEESSKAQNEQHAEEPTLQAQIDALRGAITREWKALSETSDQSARQLSDQAESLGQTFAAAAHLALRGFERAETRLSAIENDLQSRMAELSRDIQAVVAELRSAQSAALPPPPAKAFPLESVMRIHEELRDGDGGPATGPAALTSGLDAFSPMPPRELPAATEPSTALMARLAQLERVVNDTTATRPQPEPPERRPYFVISLLVASVVVALFTLWLQRRADTRLNDAVARISSAERQRDERPEAADARAATARQEAARQVAEAQQSALQAQTVGHVLAAPDLVRYWLIGQGARPRAYAQVLFSRSRGMVFSASRLPAAPAGKTYQLWLLTRGGPLSADLVSPDQSGRVTIIRDVPPTVPTRLTGAMLTLEPAGGSAQPSGTPVLSRTN